MTNRKLTHRSLPDQLNVVFAFERPDLVIIREKDLVDEELYGLSEKIRNICNEYRVEWTISSNPELCLRLGGGWIHLGFHQLNHYDKPGTLSIRKLGVSVHSVSEAIKAEEMGADYLIAGHIFQTDCKKDLKPRGLSFLQTVCESVQIPVYAIGGITKENIPLVLDAKAKGICQMSEYMRRNPIQCDLM